MNNTSQWNQVKATIVYFGFPSWLVFCSTILMSYYRVIIYTYCQFSLFVFKLPLTRHCQQLSRHPSCVLKSSKYDSRLFGHHCRKKKKKNGKHTTRIKALELPRSHNCRSPSRAWHSPNIRRVVWDRL